MGERAMSARGEDSTESRVCPAPACPPSPARPSRGLCLAPRWALLTPHPPPSCLHATSRAPFPVLPASCPLRAPILTKERLLSSLGLQPSEPCSCLSLPHGTPLSLKLPPPVASYTLRVQPKFASLGFLPHPWLHHLSLAVTSSRESSLVALPSRRPWECLPAPRPEQTGSNKRTYY